MTAQGSHRSALPAVAAPAIGLLLDRLLGEPPTSVHPVARFGQLMDAVERRAYADDRIAGVAYGVTGIAVTAAVAAVKRWTFVPAKRGDEAVDGWVNVPIDFKLG